MLPGSLASPRYDEPRSRLCFAHLVTHYWSSGHSLPHDGVLLERASRLAGVPGVLIEGTLDLGNLVGTPWLLAAAWPGSELQLIDDAGPDGSAALSAAIVAASDRFAWQARSAHG